MFEFDYFRLVMVPLLALTVFSICSFVSSLLLNGNVLFAFLVALQIVTPLAFVAVFLCCCRNRDCLTVAQVLLVLDITLCLGVSILDQLNIFGFRGHLALFLGLDRWISCATYILLKIICVLHAGWAKSAFQTTTDTQLRQPLISPPVAPPSPTASSLPYYAGIAEPPPSITPIAVQPQFLKSSAQYQPTINDSTSYVPAPFNGSSSNNSHNSVVFIVPPSTGGALSTATLRACRSVGLLLLAFILSTNSLASMEFFLLDDSYYVFIATPASLFTLVGALCLFSQCCGRRGKGVARALFALDVVCGLARVITVAVLDVKKQQQYHAPGRYIAGQLILPLSFLLFVLSLQITGIRVANRAISELL